MSLVRDGLALVGLYVVLKTGYRVYVDHVSQPLERFLTDVFDDETSRYTPPAAPAPSAAPMPPSS